MKKLSKILVVKLVETVVNKVFKNVNMEDYINDNADMIADELIVTLEQKGYDIEFDQNVMIKKITSDLIRKELISKKNIKINEGPLVRFWVYSDSDKKCHLDGCFSSFDIAYGKYQLLKGKKNLSIAVYENRKNLDNDKCSTEQVLFGKLDFKMKN